jgi:hypothetical protein
VPGTGVGNREEELEIGCIRPGFREYRPIVLVAYSAPNIGRLERQLK